MIKSNTLKGQAGQTTNGKASSPADAATLWSFLASGLAPAQVFAVQPGRDTLLLGSQGTQVFVPASAWELPSGSGPVRLQLREFYSTADIVLAGLSTTASGELLETGGMLYLTASTVDGKSVALRNGQGLGLRMPTARYKDGMELFTGTESPGRGINWQQANRPAKAARENIDWNTWRRSLRQKENLVWPLYAKGNGRLRKQLAQLIPYSSGTLQRLQNTRQLSRAGRSSLRYESRANNQKVLRIVHVDFWVDTTGATVKAVPTPDTDAELGAAVAAAMLRLPRRLPARLADPRNPYRTLTSPAKGQATVLFTNDGNVLVKNDSWDYLSVSQTRQRSMEAYDSAQFVAIAARSRAQFTEGSTAAIDENSAYYEFSANGLGWINCDRFMKSTRPKVRFVVEAEDPGTIITLMFADMRSFLRGETGKGTATVFAGLPEGTPATIIALKRNSGTTYLAMRPVAVGQQTQRNLEFQAVTIAELRKKLTEVK